MDSPPIIGGRPVEADVTAIDGPELLGGTVIPMHGGGTTYQSTPPSRWAPLTVNAERLDIGLTPTSLDEHSRLLRLAPRSRDRPLEVWIEEPFVERWVIPVEPKATWTLSRSMPWPLVSPETHPLEAWITSGAAETPLAVVQGTTAGAGQLAYSLDDVTQVVTADLSASAGQYLELRYWPLRLFSIAVAREVTVDSVELELEFVEHIPERTYAGPD
ncbi:MAG: hypothetical protein AAGM22_22700 [Acidobacteriota bacterium]